MGKFYARERGSRDWRTGRVLDSVVGIDLVDTTTGVNLWMEEGDRLISLRLSPHEADRLARVLVEVAEDVREANT